jgi:uncharacterized protein YecE (DUF72 family)
LGEIRAGIGGWVYPPWRGTFYPKGLPQARELAHASRQVTAIEINGTFYGSQKPDSFRKWAAETPEDFVFAVKGPRWATHRKDLSTAGEAIERFAASGVRELGDKLGPVLWQLPPMVVFEPPGFADFLGMLPTGMRHALEPRHASFGDPAALALMREHDVALARIDAEGAPPLEADTASFTYARLKRMDEAVATGYADAELAAIAGRAREESARGDVFVFFINGAKVRAPAAAAALLERLAAV